jgi:alkylated DNA repair dioxygenase AlkB
MIPTSPNQNIQCTTIETKAYVKHHLSGFGCVELGAGSSLWILPNFLTENVRQGILAELRDHDAFFQRPMGAYGKRIPRGQMAFGVGAYRYGRLTVEATPTPPYIQLLLDHLRKQSSISTVKFVLVNKYEDGCDSVSAHADDETMLVKDDPIFSLSLGARRRFVVRQKTVVGPLPPNVLFDHPTIAPTRISVEVAASDNVMIVMAGPRFQTDFVHELPKESKVTAVRYNLTFRSMQ